MGEFVHNGIRYEELPNGQARVLGPDATGAPSSGPIYGLARQPTPQTPDQAQGQALQNVHTQQQIDTQPLQNENTRVNIQQGQAGIQNQRFNQNQGLRQEFNNLPEVKNYSVALQSLGTALKAPDTPQGDLAIIYAYAKAADPGSVVREGEMDMATATASLPEKYKADALRLTQGKRLPPEVRTGLVETMRQSVGGMRQVYDQQRDRYSTLAQQNGFDPQQIVGQPLYDAYRKSEENYITAHGGTPRIDGVPVGAVSTAPRDIGTQQDPRLTELNPAQKAAYDAFWGANPNPTPEQLTQFGSTIGLDITNAKDIIAAKQQGRGLSSDIQAVPNISDVRTNPDSIFEAVDAGIRGAADTASFGLADKAAALGDTILNPDTTFQQNLARQYAISDYDAANHPFSRIGAQVAGGFAMPLGEINTLPQLVGKGAAAGAAYGAGSSRTLGDVPVNALLGGATGAALPAALAGAGRGVSALRGGPKEIPPLVDPATGELNQPMDAMSPAQRIQQFNDVGINTVTPGMAGGRSARVIEQGFNNLPGSAGAMEDVNSVVSGEARRAMQGTAQKFGSSKTLNEGGAALQEGANQRIERGTTVIGKAYNAIPIAGTAQASKANTVGALQQLTGRFQSNPKLAEAMHDPQLARYLDAFQNGNISWQDLKQFRTIIGEKIGDMQFGESSSKSDLRALYGALSQDMRDTASAQGPKALRAFERANTLNRQNEELIQGALTRILGPGGDMSPEKAAAAVQAMTKGGKSTGDLKILAQVRAATIKSGAWDEIASTLIHLGGQPANSEGRAFNPQTFVQWYADMSEPARAMLFKPELRKSLDQFVSVSQQLSRVKGLTNTSNTTPTMIGSGLIAAGGVAAVTHPTALLAMLAGGAANLGMAKAWTNPMFVRLITGYGRAATTGNANAVRSQIGRLSKLAATNPELREPIESLLKKIANDNLTPSAAASQSDNGNQNQQ